MGKETFQIIDDLISWIIDLYDDKITITKTFDDIYIASYFSSEIEYANAINVLISTNHFIALPPVFRSLFEAHIDLINLCKYDDYYKVLYALFLHQDIKDWQAHFEESDNDFLPNVDEIDIDVGKEIKNQRQELKRVKNEINKFGKDIFKIKNRFKLAGMGDAYQGIYSVLSSDAHNDLLRVESRHLKQVDGNTTIFFDNQWSIDQVKAPIITLPGILTRSLNDICLRFDIDEEQRIMSKHEEVTDKLKSIIAKNS